VEHLQVDAGFYNLLQVAFGVPHHDVQRAEGLRLLRINYFHQIDEKRVA
jgi:hypothetical protein